MKKIGMVIGVVIILAFIAGIIGTIYAVANMDNSLPSRQKSCELCTTEPCPCVIDEINN